MSLSPLYKLQTSDLHVNTASAFHQSFLWLRPELVKVTHLSGPIKGALMNPPETIRVSERVTIFFAVLAPQEEKGHFQNYTFISPL